MRYIYINIYIQYGMKDDKVFVLTGFKFLVDYTGPMSL